MDDKLALLQQNVAVLISQHSEINRRLDGLFNDAVKKAEFDALKVTVEGTSSTLVWGSRIVFGIVISAVLGVVLTSNPLAH